MCTKGSPARCATTAQGGVAGRRGFTLIDVLVSMAVIAILIALMLPSLGKVRESAQQVVCRSQVRQIGLGLAMYAEARGDLLPATTYITPQGTPSTRPDAPSETIALRVFTGTPLRWDGLGRLFASEDLPSAKIFYCPAHTGDYPFLKYAAEFSPDGVSLINGNYQFRGKGPNGSAKLSQIEPRRSALVADGMRTRSDYSHKVGSNVLRADLSVYWYDDPKGNLMDRLDPAKPTPPRDMEYAWDQLDGGR